MQSPSGAGTQEMLNTKKAKAMSVEFVVFHSKVVVLHVKYLATIVLSVRNLLDFLMARCIDLCFNSLGRM
jgi:hypothetical protein